MEKCNEFERRQDVLSLSEVSDSFDKGPSILLSQALRHERKKHMFCSGI